MRDRPQYVVGFLIPNLRYRWVICMITLASCISCSSAKTNNSVDDNSTKHLPINQKSTITLSAAASSKNVMEAVIESFETTTGIKVKLNTGSSSMLANQVIAGAPVDVFLSANTQWADEVEKAGFASKKERLLSNHLVLIVPESNPASISKPQDLTKKEVIRIALAGENVPAGQYATQALTRLNLIEQLNSSKKIIRGQDVRTALSYVERGEVETGIVYSTDVSISSEIKKVYVFDTDLHDEIVYVMVKTKIAESNPATNDFLNYLRSSYAMDIYARFGFDFLEIIDRSGVH